MSKPMGVLIVEDSENDALLLVRELKRGGYDLTFERVETEDAMRAALDKKEEWDVIIADHSLPHFSAPDALELLHEKGMDLPFIVVSGAIGEETAVDLF
ncbi:MAG: response regulator [Candidatus Omnitrophota bacterium]|nr:response regulator [Candidatus Omnitrophota bacterium]